MWGPTIVALLLTATVPLAALALAGYDNSAFIGGEPMMVVLMCASTFCIAGGFSNPAPFTVESYGVKLDARSSGFGQMANGFGKIIGPLSRALIAGTSSLVSPNLAAAAVFSAFLFRGLETYGKAIALDHGTTR